MTGASTAAIAFIPLTEKFDAAERCKVRRNFVCHPTYGNQESSPRAISDPRDPRFAATSARELLADLLRCSRPNIHPPATTPDRWADVQSD